MKNLILIITIFLIVDLSAQNISFTDDYQRNPFLYNPAKAGINSYFLSEEHSNIYVSHRNYWLPSSNNGGIQTASYNTKLKNNNIGLGATVFQQNTHILSKTGIVLSYAYHLDFGDTYESGTSKLSIGLNTSFLNQRLDLENGNIYDLGDPQLYENSWEGNYLNFGLGLAYRIFGFDFDFAANNLLGSDFSKAKKSNPFYKNHGGMRPNIFTSMKYTIKATESGIYNLQPYFAFYSESTLPIEYNLGVNHQINLDKVSLFVGLGIEMFSGLDSDLEKSPFGISSNLGMEVFDKFSFTIFYGTMTNYYNQAGYNIGLQAGYKIGKRD